MNKKLLTMIVLTFAISLAACTKNAPAPPPAPSGETAGNTGNQGAVTVDVQAIYKQNCVSCHGANLSGGEGPNLQKAGARLSADQIADKIANGAGGMLAFKGTLQNEEIHALVQWLASNK